MSEHNPDPNRSVRHTIALDGDEFMLAVPGVEGHLVRTGRGNDTASVTAFEVGAVQLANLTIGFPSVAEATGTSESLILCTMLKTPGAGTWEGIPLAAGQTYVYPLTSTHHAQDPGGLEFAMTVIPCDAFERAAVRLGYDPRGAATKHVVDGGPLWSTVAALHGAHRTTFAISAEIALDRVLDSAVHTVCARPDAGSAPPTRGWSDADLVRDATAVIERSGEWTVPMLTLCRTVGASERRLELAFERMLGVGPRAFMRFRALQAAHRGLRDSDPATTRVADIARSHRFGHLGRFAQLYRAVYGESPSVTLGRSPQGEG